MSEFSYPAVTLEMHAISTEVVTCAFLGTSDPFLNYEHSYAAVIMNTI